MQLKLLCTWLKTTLAYLVINLVINSGAKRGLVVAKKLVVNDFWLVVNGGLAAVVGGSCKYRGLIKSSLYFKETALLKNEFVWSVTLFVLSLPN